jgi:hypothetical protein
VLSSKHKRCGSRDQRTAVSAHVCWVCRSLTLCTGGCALDTVACTGVTTPVLIVRDEQLCDSDCCGPCAPVLQSYVTDRRTGRICWGAVSSGMWRRVVGRAVPDVSKDRDAFIVSVKKSKSLCTAWPWTLRPYDLPKRRGFHTHQHGVTYRKPELPPCGCVCLKSRSTSWRWLSP